MAQLKFRPCFTQSQMKLLILAFSEPKNLEEVKLQNYLKSFAYKIETGEKSAALTVAGHKAQSTDIGLSPTDTYNYLCEVWEKRNLTVEEYKTGAALESELFGAYSGSFEPKERIEEL